MPETGMKSGGSKKYEAIATDYDGTIALKGTVDGATLAALNRAGEAGMRRILVTGRELTDLLTTFPHIDLFDRIVAENGAVLYDPKARTSRPLAPAPPRVLVDALNGKAVPVSIGRSIIATAKPHEETVLEAIRDLGLEWHVIFNKDAVMALPAGVTKATGLRAALGDLHVAPERTVGVGDAENDHTFLRVCGLSAAVANAVPAIRDAVDLNLPRDHGGGVIELIDLLLSGRLDQIPPQPANHDDISSDSARRYSGR